MGKKVEESDSLPSASEPSAIDSGKLSCGVADKVSATVAMKSGAENPGNDSSYQNQSLRLFPTIARKIRREIASGRKFRHREIPVSELPDNGYLRDFEFKKGAEREKMLSSLEFISSKINSDPSLPKKYPVVVAADSCFTNNLVVGLFEDFLWSDAMSKYFTHAKLSYRKNEDDEAFAEKIHDDALVLGGGSYEDTYSIASDYYDGLLCRYMRKAAAGNDPEFNVRFLNTCFSHQLFGNNLGILNRESPFVSATVKGPAQFSVTSCRVLPTERESEVVREALKHVCPDPKAGARFSVASTRTGYQYYDLLGDGDARLSREMGIIPLAVDEVSGTIIIAATPNDRVFTVQPHPEIDLVDPSNVMAEIASVAHYLTPLYGVDRSLAENYDLKNPDGTPYVKCNGGLPFYVGVVNALLDDAVRNLRSKSAPASAAPVSRFRADRIREIEKSVWVEPHLEATDEHLEGVMTFFLHAVAQTGEDVARFRARNARALDTMVFLMRSRGFGGIDEIQDGMEKDALAASYSRYRNFLRYRRLDEEGKICPAPATMNVSGLVETTSDSLGLADLGDLLLRHRRSLLGAGLLGESYAFRETNASGHLLTTLRNRFHNEDGLVFYGTARQIPVNPYEILVSSGFQEEFAWLMEIVLRSLDSESLQVCGFTREMIEEHFIPKGMTPAAMNDFMYALVARKVSDELSRSSGIPFSASLKAAVGSVSLARDSFWYVNSQNTRNAFAYEDFAKFKIPGPYLAFFRSEHFGTIFEMFRERIEEGLFRSMYADLSHIAVWDGRVPNVSPEMIMVSPSLGFQNSAEYVSAIESAISDASCPGSIVIDASPTQKGTYVPRLAELSSVARAFEWEIEVFAVLDKASNLIRSAFFLRKPYDVETVRDSLAESCELVPISKLEKNPYFRLQSVVRKYVSSNFKHPAVFRSLNANRGIDSAISGLMSEAVSAGAFEEAAAIRFQNGVLSLVNRLAIKLNALGAFSAMLKKTGLEQFVNSGELELRLGEAVDQYFDAKEGMRGHDLETIDMVESPGLWYDKLWAENTDPAKLLETNIDKDFLRMIVERLFNGILPPEGVFRILQSVLSDDIGEYVVYDTLSDEGLTTFSKEINEDVEDIFKDGIVDLSGFDVSARPIEEMLREALGQGIPPKMEGELLGGLHYDFPSVRNTDFVVRLRGAQKEYKRQRMEEMAEKLKSWLPPWAVAKVFADDRAIMVETGIPPLREEG